MRTPTNGSALVPLWREVDFEFEVSRPKIYIAQSHTRSPVSISTKRIYPPAKVEPKQRGKRRGRRGPIDARESRYMFDSKPSNSMHRCPRARHHHTPARNSQRPRPQYPATTRLTLVLVRVHATRHFLSALHGTNGLVSSSTLLPCGDYHSSPHRDASLLYVTSDKFTRCSPRYHLHHRQKSDQQSSERVPSC